MRPRGLSSKHWWLAAVLLVVATVLGVTVNAGGGDGGQRDRDAAERAMSLVPRYLADRPGRAARLALAADRLEPSVEAELSMLSVAVDSAGVSRVFADGSTPITAAVATSNLVVTADEAKVLRIWSGDGMLRARLRVPEKIVALTDTYDAPLVAAADAGGHLSLLDLSDPSHPGLRRLPAPSGGPPMAIAFSDDAVEIVTVSPGGLVKRFDTMTGALTDRWSLREASGALPWQAGSAKLKLAAVAFDANAYGSDERLLVGTPGGVAVRIELKQKRGRTLIPAGYAPGRITGVAEVAYGHEVALATTGGYVTREDQQSKPVVWRGSKSTGVAFDAEDALWIASREGVRRQRISYGEEQIDFAGRPATALTASGGGVVAINPNGAISQLGEPSTGVGLPTVTSSSFAAFDSNDKLLVAESSFGSAYELTTLKPGHGHQYGQDTPNPELLSYEPDPNWWEDGESFAVDSGAIDEEFAVAGGQDPTGTAVVLVWDAESGHPLRRLPLTTGGVETREPSVVTEVLLLPGKHLLAAYSAVQQLIAIWSTDQWEQVASVPVGAIGSMAASPNESEIVAIGGSDEESEGGAKLVFVDVEAGKLDDEVPFLGVSDAGWSPDGSRLAVADVQGRLHIMTGDGKDELRRPIQLEGEPIALAWRPDGEEIAVSLGESIVLVDPVGSAVSPPLPDLSYAEVHHLHWSPDGRFLAAAASEWGEYSEAYEPAPVQLWTVSAPRLRRRMCQLAGGSMTAGEWNALVGTSEPRQLCRPPSLRRPNTASGKAVQLDHVDFVFRRAGHILAADTAGHVAEMGRAPTELYPLVSTSWSVGGFSWARQGEVGMLQLRSGRAHEWTCICRGAALHEDNLIALGSDGRQLFEFSPGRGLSQSIPIRGGLGQEPQMIGFLDDQAIVAGYATMPSRATPSTLYLLDPEARVTRLAVDEHGLAHPPFAQSSAGNVLAFVSTVSGGVCYSPDTIGIVTRSTSGRPVVAYPPMPGDEEPQVVRSLLVHPDGTVEAAIAPIGCNEDGTSPTSPPDATRYILRGGNWIPTADHAYDIQRVDGSATTLSTPPRYEYVGDLSLHRGGEKSRSIASAVEQVWAHP